MLENLEFSMIFAKKLTWKLILNHDDCHKPDCRNRPG